MSVKSTPKGMRDIGPEDMYVREEAIGRIRSIFKNYGFRPIETPAMEYLDTLRAKAGAEVEKQIFVIDGGEYGLRFDLTVPLARYASSSDSPKPFKRYAIDVVWRKEEPQRGRFREFYQADADIIGSNSMRSESEALTLAREVCFAFGFTQPRILVNNRKILDGVAKKLEINEEQKGEVFRILDKLDKIGEVEVRKLLVDVIGDKTEELLDVLNSKGGNKEKLDVAANYSFDGAEELAQIEKFCPFDIEIDLSLVRGLGYYTGPVFEVKLGENMGSIAGGGRYDNLLGVYGQSFPAVGISFGIERLITLLLEKQNTDAAAEKSSKKTDTLVLVAAIKSDFYAYSLRVAGALRAAGIPSETDLNERNLRKQFDYANALSIPYVAVVGEREAKEKTITLRNMTTGVEEVVSIENAILKVRG